MERGLLLPPLSRATLPPLPVRLERLGDARPQVLAVLEGETDAIARQATFARLLWDVLPQLSWCGFYRRVGPRTLAVGPYQGSLGCLRIDFDRGVCGAAARTQRAQRVADVRQFPGHIACDDAARSELVLPVVTAGTLRAVLDLDSTFLDAFSEEEAALLTELVAACFHAPELVW